MRGQQRYSDDEFDRALRELAEGTAGEPRFREASAAERARQAKQQAKRARKQAKRRHGRGRRRADVFTYAIEPPGAPTDWMRFLAHQYGSFNFAQWNDPGRPLQPWDQTSIGHAGIRCGSTDGYQHPDYPSERVSGAGGTQSGPAIDPYSNATDAPGGAAACGRTTGT
jgi:hypothetical protein